MGLYSRALRHVDINRVKELREDKIKQEKIAEEIREQIKEELKNLNSPEFSNWRHELSEMMTTSDVFSTTLPGTGDTEYSVSETSIVESGDDLFLHYDTSVYNILIFDIQIIGEGVSLILATVPLAELTSDDILLEAETSGTYSISVPQSKDFVLNYLKAVSLGGDPDGRTAIIEVRAKRTTPLNVFVPLDSPEAAAFIRTDPILSNLSPQERLKKLKEMLEASDEYLLKMFGADFPGSGAVPPGEAGDTPSVEVTDIQPQETPKTFAQTKLEQDVAWLKSMGKSFTQGYLSGLPRSEANAIKKAMGMSVSDSQSRDKSKSIDQGRIDELKAQIESRTRSQTTGSASSQKYYSSPSMQSALDSLKAQLAAAEKDFADKYGSTEMPGDEVAEPSETQLTQQQLADLDKKIKYYQDLAKKDALSAQNKKDIERLVKLGLLSAVAAAALLSPVPGDEAAAGTALGAAVKQGVKQGAKTGAKTAAQRQTLDAFRRQVNSMKTLSRAQDAINRAPKGFKGDVAIPVRVQGRTINVKANEILRNKGFKVDSYQPQGQVISEKKLKSPQEVLNKIPGYYDGKPAPLGFPVEPPPKTVNGYHPDLVDGKKVADRFNRLDPESAKAMPPTGNPHIDKKVKAAAKKPK